MRNKRRRWLMLRWSASSVSLTRAVRTGASKHYAATSAFAGALHAGDAATIVPRPPSAGLRMARHPATPERQPRRQLRQHPFTTLSCQTTGPTAVRAYPTAGGGSDSVSSGGAVHCNLRPGLNQVTLHAREQRRAIVQRQAERIKRRMAVGVAIPSNFSGLQRPSAPLNLIVTRDSIPAPVFHGPSSDPMCGTISNLISNTQEPIERLQLDCKQSARQRALSRCLSEQLHHPDHSGQGDVALVCRSVTAASRSSNVVSSSTRKAPTVSGRL